MKHDGKCKPSKDPGSHIHNSSVGVASGLGTHHQGPSQVDGILRYNSLGHRLCFNRIVCPLSSQATDRTISECAKAVDEILVSSMRYSANATSCRVHGTAVSCLPCACQSGGFKETMHQPATYQEKQKKIRIRVFIVEHATCV